MKNIDAIITELGIDLGDKAEAFKTALAENYKTVAEVSQKNERIQALEFQLSEATTALKAVEQAKDGDADALAKLKEQVAAFEQKESARLAAEEEARSKAEFSNQFKQALGSKEFANGLVASTVEAKAYETAKANPAMELNAIIAGIVGDADGIWKNPQKEAVKGMQAGDERGVSSIQNLEDLKNLSEKEINENWAAVSRLLAR